MISVCRHKARRRHEVLRTCRHVVSSRLSGGAGTQGSENPAGTLCRHKKYQVRMYAGVGARSPLAPL